MAIDIRRRKLLASLTGAAAWPITARAQQSDRVRHIGVLMNTRPDESEGQVRVTALVQGLQKLGWTDGRNAQIDIRWAADDAGLYRRYAAELLASDVIVASALPSVVALQQVTRSVPIVFAVVIDPVGAGIVDSLARPGGNTTGFTVFEYSISGKWLELLREVAPNVTRVAVIRDTNVGGIGQFAAIQSTASSLGVELKPIAVRDAGDIEQAVAAFARPMNDGLIVTASSFIVPHHNLIFALAARYRLPAVYPFRFYAANGGLLSYGPDLVDNFTRAASYVDRILKGEKPADLPVQAPTKYELVVNVKTANALGLTLPTTLLARADEVIE
jgi:putative tryptophan/tyrosine transport system substrate-binding protein